LHVRPERSPTEYADGSVEQVKQDGGFLLGMMEGMEYDSHKVVLRRSNGAPLKDLLQAIQSDLANFVAGAPQADDITMLALQYKGRSGA
jgi:serine phosphatase RsbU (regulator of sigma subunit)